MKAVLLGSTIWHTQYPQKMNLGCLECLVNDSLPRKRQFPLYFNGHIMLWSSAIISCMQIINYNMLASNNISSNFRLHQISNPSKFLPTLWEFLYPTLWAPGF
jgi:hypothetical protein